MKINHTTVMLLSESSNQTRSFKIPSFLLWVIIAIIVLLLIGTVSSFFLSRQLVVSEQHSRELLEENSLLLQENKKIQLLEDNLKANTLLLKKVLNLAGVSTTGTEAVSQEAQASAIAAFLESSDTLLNLPQGQAPREIVELIPSGMPCPGRITRGFNPEDDNLSRRHFGVDIVNKEGTKLFATADGRVEVAGWDDIYGKMIIIDHSSESKSENYKTVYGHNLVNLVSEGEVVKKGDLIALSGNTGKSTGPHTHYEIRLNNLAIDPEPFLKNPNPITGK